MSSSGQAPPRRFRLPVVLRTGSETATRSAGESLASLLGPGDVVALSGPLGAGKTCFAGGLAKGLGTTDRVASPTFALVREYRGRLAVRHIDLYRLEPAEIEELDWRDLLDGRTVAVIEWAEKACSHLPDQAYHVSIDPDPSAGPTGRVISIRGPVAHAPAVDPREDRRRPAPSSSPRLTVLRLASISRGGPRCVLAIDTSTRARSLALLRGLEVWELFWDPDQAALPAEDLSAGQEQLLAAAGVGPADLELVAVSLGPGSFTGVKIGLASAKALAYALGCPLKGVPTLDLLAAGALSGHDRGVPGDRPSAVLALVDARRGDAFGALYCGGPEPLPDPSGGGPYRLGPAAEVAAVLLRRLLETATAGSGSADRGTRARGPFARGACASAVGYPPWLVLAGDGADGVEVRDSELPGWRVRLAPAHRHPRARDLVVLARDRLVGSAGDDPFVLQPLYLREPDIKTPVRRDAAGRPELPGGGQR